MARQSSPIEYSSFSKGLVSDSSPLNQQPDSAIDIQNFRLLKDGTVKRRNGLQKTDTTYTLPSIESYESYFSSVDGEVDAYVWSGANEDNSTTLLVISFRDSEALRTMFFKPTSSGVELVPYRTAQVSSNKPYLTNSFAYDYSFANSGNRLIRSSSEDSYIDLFKYDGTSVYKVNSKNLQVRDFWGLEDFDPDSGTDLTTGSGVSYRPVYDNSSTITSYTGNHLYNLRNQGWNRAYYLTDGSLLYDPLRWSFIPQTGDDRGASNADILSEFVYAQTDTDTGSKTVDRFHYKDYRANSPSNFRAPMGSVIIDLFKRSNSREEYLDNWGSDLDLSGGPVTVGSIDSDDDSGGATAVGAGFGRFWYSGFKINYSTRTTKSPNLQQFVTFSQLINDDTKYAQCYQEQDPTDKDAPDILDTDGGHIEVTGALNISALRLYDNSMLVFADNGVWAISGEDRGYFKATSYKLTKVSVYGCISPRSIVEVDNSLLYLTDSGVVSLGLDQFGGITTQLISENVISNLYNKFSSSDLSVAQGSYDSVRGEVRWNIGNTILLFNKNLGAFYKYYIDDSLDVIGVATINKSQSLILESSVLVGSDSVLVSSDDVVIEDFSSEYLSNNTLYIIRQPDTNQMGFANTNPSSFYDWDGFEIADDSSWNEVEPSDSEAYLITAYLTAGDTLRYKQVPYLTMLFNKTEDGFYEDDLGDIYPTGQSSCKVQAQWDWTNSSNSNRWSREFQAYRQKRAYIPEDVTDGYDNGHSVVVSKTKLRGKGRALSLYMKTEEGKDCHILGWSMLLGVTSNV